MNLSHGLNPSYPIEALMAARQVQRPALNGDKVYFIGNLPGHYCFYEMSKAGGYPIPLIPEHIALQNPHLMNSPSFGLVPKLDMAIIMVDKDGNELYQPMTVQLSAGGIPQPLFGDTYKDMQVTLSHLNPHTNIAFFNIDDRKSPGLELLRVNLETHEVFSLGKDPYGWYLLAVNDNATEGVIAKGYGIGDVVLYHWKEGDEPTLFYGKPLEERVPREEVELPAFGGGYFVNDDTIITFTRIFSDQYSLAFISPSRPGFIQEVRVEGLEHTGMGELDLFEHLAGDHFLLGYNIDGCSYLYEGHLDQGDQPVVRVTKTLVGTTPPLMNGMLLGVGFDEMAFMEEGQEVPAEYVVAFTKATMPSRLFRINVTTKTVEAITNERVLGIAEDYLSEGEDASYQSHDGLRISARLYRPSPKHGFEGPRPLVYWIHGGPTGQERPDFTWFSMPLIQYLTFHGFAVFVPNVRGSTGYGFEYTSKVHRNWGGEDVLDHVHALGELEKDPLIDSTRRYVAGRSYGGYMTLMLVSKYPELFNGGCDLFGPYDFLGFFERLPPSWQEGFRVQVGDPDKPEERQMLVDRSPKTYFDQIIAPLLVIQGRNDPRIVAVESEEIVETLKSKGRDAEIIIFEDEGHDVIKFRNKVKCYQEMTKFFLRLANKE